MICKIVGWDQSRDVEVIRSPDGSKIESLEPKPWEHATLTLELSTGERVKATISDNDFKKLLNSDLSQHSEH